MWELLRGVQNGGGIEQATGVIQLKYRGLAWNIERKEIPSRTICMMRGLGLSITSCTFALMTSDGLTSRGSYSTNASNETRMYSVYGS